MHHLDWSTPISKWNGDIPDVLYFKVFGSQAYILIPKEDRQNKLSAKAEEAIFIGYEKGTKAFKFWSPKRWRVVISSTATFDEFTFTFCAQKTDDKPPLLSIPLDSDNIQESKKPDEPKSSEDVLNTYYYQFPPMEDQHPNAQIPPEEGPDDQQPSQPLTPNVPPPYWSPFIPTTSHDTEELRHGTRIRNPHFLPDNICGNRPPIKIKQDLEAQESPHPTKEEDDLGTMYSIVQTFGERLLHPLLRL